MKKLLLLLLTTGLFASCDQYLTIVENARVEMQKNATNDHFIKWATIGTFYSTMYNGCKQQEQLTNIETLLKQKPNPTTTYQPDSFGTGY